jgi:hypothetical protein
MPFEKGQSGNPAGRPPGARNKATIMAEALLQGEAEELTRSAIERAKSGDMAALRMCLDRLAPPCRHRTIVFELPPLASAADAVSALAAITAAVAAGELTPSEAGELFKLVDGFARMLEARNFEQRVADLERAGATPAPESHQGHQDNQDSQINQNDRIDRSHPMDFGDVP